MLLALLLKAMGGVISPDLMRSITSTSALLPVMGGRRVRILYRIAPSEYMSVFSLMNSNQPSACSGAMKLGVPMTVPY